MKLINITLILAMFFFISCKKETPEKEDLFLSTLTLTLKDSMAKEPYDAPDLTRAVKLHVDSIGKYYIRIPLKETIAYTSFIMLQVSKDGKLVKGRKITVYRQKKKGSDGSTFNGLIQVQSLSGNEIHKGTIVNGYAKLRHLTARVLSAESLQPDPYLTMPTVVVSATRNSDKTYTYQDWISMQYIMGDGGSGNVSYYTSLENDIYGGGGGGSYGGWGSGSIGEGELLMVDFESQGSLPAIDLEKFINCFSKIPDAGASCTIEIFADIPVDRDPNKIFDFNNGSPGHTFIQLKKTNGVQSVVQNLGFYPESGFKSVITNAPIPGKFVDNGSHEFNASFKMVLSSTNFTSSLNEILYLANFIKYDIDNYNCTDFALDILNKTRTQKIEIPLIHIPGNLPSTGTRTPQGLFLKLKEMKINGHPEAANINLNIVKGWVANSVGPCN